MKYVYSSDDPFVANLLLHKLQHEGIEAVILGEHLMSAAGGVPFHGLVRIAVTEDDYDKARDLIVSLEEKYHHKRPANIKEKAKSLFILLLLFLYLLFLGF